MTVSILLSLLLSLALPREVPALVRDCPVVEAEVDGKVVRSSEFSHCRVTSSKVEDALGSGREYSFRYHDCRHPFEMKRVVTVYDGEDFVTCRLELSSEKPVRSAYLAPLCVRECGPAVPHDSTSRVIRVPFDNDGFVSWLSEPFPVRDESYEVTVLFHGYSRKGLVVGSLEHDTWKSAVRYDVDADGSIEELTCYAGAATELTRDVNPKRSHTRTRHGAVSGNIVSSPKMFVGEFNDWRRGLEKFGECNSALRPPLHWETSMPCGWNSWAAMATKVNYEGAVSVSDFFRDSLASFGNGVQYIGLDSFWDRFSDEQLAEFARHCHENGQLPGIYWCPFSDWIGNRNAEVEGTGGKWHYRDIYLRSGGQMLGVESWAVDPTHEGTRMRMEYYIDRFRRLGFKYLKLDFLNNGTMEADSFFDPSVTTGVQAYNSGMAYLHELCGDDMFLALSIAPVFPYGYGHSRRISCDTWGAMKETGWGTTGYMLNSLSFGWWLDRVYAFNDPDHVLLYKPEEAEFYDDASGRARITSALMTGLYMLGDNLSDRGEIPGDPEDRAKVLRLTSHPEINALAGLGHSFYPVEGWLGSGPESPEPLFMYTEDGTVYLAAFNFSRDSVRDFSLNPERLGLGAGASCGAVELWSGERFDFRKGFIYFSVPAGDVKVFRIFARSN